MFLFDKEGLLEWNLNFVFDHCGRNGTLNVYLKYIGTARSFSTGFTPKKGLHPYLRTIFMASGPKYKRINRTNMSAHEHVELERNGQLPEAQRKFEESDDLLWPKAIWFIVPNEFGERFNYYGSKPLFTKYLTRFYGLKTTDVVIWTSTNNFLTYFLPLFGAAISDSYLGKYKTIVYLSIIYAIGTILLATFSVPGWLVPLIPSSLSAEEVLSLKKAGEPLPGPRCILFFNILQRIIWFPHSGHLSYRCSSSLLVLEE